MDEFNVKKSCTECSRYKDCSPDKIKHNLRDGRCGNFQNQQKEKSNGTNR